MSKEIKRLTQVEISRPDHFEECRTCPSATDAMDRALEDNLTFYLGTHPMTVQSFEIDCNKSAGGRSKQIDGEFIDGPNTTMSIKLVGEVEFLDRNDSQRIQNRRKKLTYGVDCPHYFPTKIKKPTLIWKEYKR